jgi:maleylpyruvate isomerase
MENSREAPRTAGQGPGDLTGLNASAVALNRTVDALTDDELSAPSLLPGWTRAHVVAHLALNGHAMARVLDAVGRGEPAAMYESDERRDAEISEHSQDEPDVLRDRLLAATTEFSDAVEARDDAAWAGSFTRIPSGPSWPAATLVATRRREVEIHHADLGAAYTHHDWPEDFVAELLDAVTVDHAGAGPFRVRATDLGRDWAVGGDGGPTVAGLGSDLGWWLTGRSTGEGLTSESGTLPPLGPWRRASGPSVS